MREDEADFHSFDFYLPAAECWLLMRIAKARDFKSNIPFAPETRDQTSFLLEFRIDRIISNLSRNVYLWRAYIDRHPISIKDKH